jgi:hypothetical protein
MPKDTISLDRYISHSMKNVPGFLRTLDAQVIRTLLLHQDESSIHGHLCEIGVHHGRLFLMLALARRTGERALAIDLFEDDPLNANTPHAGRDGGLWRHARRLGIELSPEEIFKTSSVELEAADVMARTTGAIRFFSVDGGHSYHHVANDLRLAQKTLSPGGIIAVDDFFNIRWADVSFATYDFLRSTDSVVPFAVTQTKIYLAPPAVAESYQASLRKRPELGRFSSTEVLKHNVLELRQHPFSKGVDLLRAAVRERAS